MKHFTPRTFAAASGAALLGTAVLVSLPHSHAQTATAKPPSILQSTTPRGRAPQVRNGAAAGAPSRVKAKPKAAKPALANPTAASGYVQRPLPAWVRGKAIGRVHVKNHERVIALTFDDGPWPVYTDAILDILKRENVHATFFMIGRNVASHPALARRVAAEGHAIGNHTWNHPSRPRGAKTEIDRTDAVLKQTLGFTPNLFRPPYGMLRNGLAATAYGEGKAVVLWSADSRDWNHASAGSIYSTIMRQSGPGGIALMHDGGGNRAATAAALPDIIASLKARGYRFATIPELLAMHAPPAPHKSAGASGKAGKAGKNVKKPAKQVAARPLGKPSPARTPVASKPHIPATPARPSGAATPALKKGAKPAPRYSAPKPAATPVISRPRTAKPKSAVPAKPRKPRATAPSLSSPPRHSQPRKPPHRSPAHPSGHAKVPSPQPTR